MYIHTSLHIISDFTSLRLWKYFIFILLLKNFISKSTKLIQDLNSVCKVHFLRQYPLSNTSTMSSSSIFVSLILLSAGTGLEPA